MSEKTDNIQEQKIAAQEAARKEEQEAIQKDAQEKHDQLQEKVHADAEASKLERQQTHVQTHVPSKDVAKTALQKQLEVRFSYHPPKGSQEERYGVIRAKALEFATLISEYSPDSKEQAKALDKLDEVVFLANAAIARNE